MGDSGRAVGGAALRLSFLAHLGVGALVVLLRLPDLVTGAAPIASFQVGRGAALAAVGVAGLVRDRRWHRGSLAHPRADRAQLLLLAAGAALVIVPGIVIAVDAVCRRAGVGTPAACGLVLGGVVAILVAFLGVVLAVAALSGARGARIVLDAGWTSPLPLSEVRLAVSAVPVPQGSAVRARVEDRVGYSPLALAEVDRLLHARLREVLVQAERATSGRGAVPGGAARGG